MPHIEPRLVFIDESGDPNLPADHPGSSPYYVISAVFVRESDIIQVNSDAAEIITRYFQSGEMKSNRVANNTRRRKIILHAIASLPVTHYSLVIDKSAIRTESGLRFKKSFIKFIHRSMYQKLFTTFPSLQIYADAQGSSAFMTEFGQYLQQRLPNTLFDSSSIEFVDSNEFPLIQVGDMIAGSISRLYSGKENRDVLESIRDQILIIDEWPPKTPHYEGEAAVPREERINSMVRTEALRLANAFIEEYSSKNDDKIQAQVAAVRYLLYHFRSVDPEDYIISKRLHEHLSNLGYEMSERLFRSGIIGKLRDRNVFIVSSNQGIKIPYDTGDLHRFTSQVNQRVIPYLNRLRIIRGHFLSATENEYDMVNPETFSDLSELL